MTTAVHTNKARLEYSIAFIGYADLVGEVEAASHQDLAGDNYYQDLAEPEDWTGALRGIQHRRDAERRVVNLLANEIYRHLGCQNTAQYKARIRAVRRGTVDLYSDMGPCHSCRSVIKDFRWDFPTLAVDVRYRNALRGGGSAALIPAGEGLFGMYGIGDAVQRPDGQWVKSYPGAPVPAATATFDVKVAGQAGDRFRGTLDAVDQQPHAPYLYPAPNATAAPLDEATAVLDKIAQAIRNQMAPGQQMRPQSFRQWIRGIDQGTVRLACERGPGQAGRTAVAAFVADFPKVRVEVVYEATAAQADGQGYADATRQPDGTWTKVFAARR
ncbi:deaminase domain-containing protein [Streptomyces erythrochromogenes]|uniref:deaminase domain-containing protein n=1 Tax=Streptomyces erythrochromogenes TaxID=285574 RepID=UPI0038128304